MTPERWQQIDDLFHAALARSAAERFDFLADRCETDEELRHEVESLLSAHDSAVDFIETPAGDVAAELLGSHQSTFAPSQHIEDYCIIRQLGRGGMSEVYLAEDARLKRNVALKLLPARFTMDPDRVRRFEREARAASTLNHPNIVTIYEIRHSGSMHFIAAEFVDGKTLRQLMNERPLKLADILNVAIQVSDALSGAHAARIVHRDIKPENIMIHRQGYVKVLDFGLAKLNEHQATSADPESPTLLQSNPGLVMGTVQYMSPEQARGKNVGMRTDVWSLGIVLYEMVAGHVPFVGETPSHVMVSLMEDELPSLKSCAQVPEELDRIVSKALRKDQRNRYQTADQFARDLRELKQKLQSDSHLSSWLSNVPSRKEELRNASEATARSQSEPSATGTVAVASLTTSSREHVIDRFKHHKRLVVAALLLLVVSAILGGYEFFAHRVADKQIQSIAVLPFVNETADANVDYLSDGIPESLIGNLSQLPDLKVTARASSYKYKGTTVDLNEVGNSLGVEAIVTGRVTRAADIFLISVEVVNTSDHSRIWADQYSRKVSELLTVETEISREIAESLGRRMTAGERQQLVYSETNNPQAYELVLKGRFYGSKGGTEDRLKAADYFQQAIAIDPKYAVAYAELSLCYNGLVNNQILDQREYIPKAEAAARTALQLNERCAECHRAMAVARVNAWDWQIAEQEFKRAIELNPNLSLAHVAYAMFLNIHLRADEALVEARRARDLDPISRGPNAVVVYGLLLAGQLDEALRRVKDMRELEPNNPDVYSLLAQVHNARGEYTEATAAYNESIKFGDDSPDAQIFLGAAYAKVGQPAKTRAMLKQLKRGKQYISPVGFAILQTALGEHDEALTLLESAYAAHDQQLIWLRVESGGAFGPLAGKPRFQDLLRRMGLT